eukprot:Protomagalhaensia_sp_Gyna_25__3124@NODE_285_length_4042_cov_82_977517_g219_i0_p2_GENE_NODE_285_length_4042_cov_82_977517_g219_i0NODE_285_length_4042_cov_82_977517_g219_i0_p2_ORF_typecomplete_len308_score39_02His_Phos_1/PF00300_22/8_2e22_NODE_285_length_4042_cov_82_977517_g219_i07571680
MRVLLVRHGESYNNYNALKGPAGDTELSDSPDRIPDPPLTAEGSEGGSYCAKWLEEQITQWPGDQCVRVLCSPMRRALQSASPLHQTLEAPVWVDPDICELGGLFSGKRPQGNHPENMKMCPREYVQGLTADEIKTDFGGSYITAMLPSEGGWWNRPPESARDTRRRARLLYRRLAYCSGATVADLSESKGGWWTDDAWEKGQSRVLVIVTHGLFFDFLMQIALNVNSFDREVCFMMDNWACSALEFRPVPRTEDQDLVQEGAAVSEAAPPTAAISAVLQCHNFCYYLPPRLRREQRLRGKHVSFIK